MTVRRGTLKALGVAPDDLTYHLTTEQKLRLEALLVGHQFNVSDGISVVILASGKGVVLAQGPHLATVRPGSSASLKAPVTAQ